MRERERERERGDRNKFTFSKVISGATASEYTVGIGLV